MTWWLWSSLGGRGANPRLVIFCQLASLLPREACEPGLSSRRWGNLAAHDRVHSAASPSPWFRRRETPLLFTPDFIFSRLMYYTRGDLRWAVASPSASHLAPVCIGHKENQVRVCGLVHMVPGLESTDCCWTGACGSAGIPQDSRWPCVGPVPSSLSSFLLGEGLCALQRFPGCSRVNCAFHV